MGKAEDIRAVLVGIAIDQRSLQVRVEAILNPFEDGFDPQDPMNCDEDDVVEQLRQIVLLQAGVEKHLSEAIGRTHFAELTEREIAEGADPE